MLLLQFILILAALSAFGMATYDLYDKACFWLIDQYIGTLHA